MKEIYRKLLAEFTGTFTLVFFCTGAVIVNNIYGGVLAHPGVSAVSGLVIMVLIFALGDVSGAHLNPAVTVAFAMAGRFPARYAMPYVLSQFAGGILASLMLALLFPGHVHLGNTLPVAGIVQSFCLELMLTAFLTLVVFSVSSGSREKGMMAAIAIGATVALSVLLAGPVCGASMNPVRSFAPALVSGKMDDVWIYIIAPPTGALAGMILYRMIYGKKHGPTV